MFDAPLHPALVHLPLGLAVVVPLVAASLAVALWRGLLPGRAWAVLVGLQALLVAGGFLALRSGERDEDRVEKIVGEKLLEQHEEAGELFVFAAGGVLAIAVAGLLVRSERTRRIVLVAASAGTLAVAALGLRAGHAGGQLVYRHGAGAAYLAPGSTAPASAADADDDD